MIHIVSSLESLNRFGHTLYPLLFAANAQQLHVKRRMSAINHRRKATRLNLDNVCDTLSRSHKDLILAELRSCLKK